jgi:hypothetical protein
MRSLLADTFEDLACVLRAVRTASWSSRSGRSRCDASEPDPLWPGGGLASATVPALNLINTQSGHVPVIVTSGQQARRYTELKGLPH